MQPLASSTTQVHEHVSCLTPVKARRRKRPSLSPTKAASVNTTPITLKLRTQSEILLQKPSAPRPEEDLATASLNFDEFSFWDAECRTMCSISKDHMNALVGYLCANYGIVMLQESLPFLILWCENSPPPSNKRPFLIAGCITVWLGKGDSVPPDICVGNFGDLDPIEIDNSIGGSLKPYCMPDDKTLCRILSEYFPEANGISYISHTIVVEFPRSDADSWYRRLLESPSGFLNVGVGLSYTNGPLLATELKRLKAPNPTTLETIKEDDSDYVKSQGCFFPGSMLQAKSGNQISAGIHIQKGIDTRLTVAFHSWDKEFLEMPENLGDHNHFTITQGETLVGSVIERIGSTDIGLAKLKDGVSFSNQFLDLPTSAKKLLPFDEVGIMDDFLFDSFVTGRQRIKCLGKRIIMEGKSKAVLKGNPDGLPEPRRYTELRQGIYATNSPEIHGHPKVREGVCGSALVRSKRAADGSNRLEEGEVAGFMHWSDLQLKYDVSGNLMCFADSVDSLIEEGWRVA
ncbi:MAG: hypothetical protein M1839_001163 [Geoglossum umbratile]|nr:MAG: hypothetical protein M1839_001163 [Geoglossum umbratile]